MPVELSLKLREQEKSSYKKRKIVAWITVLSIILCIVLFIPKPAYADIMDDASDVVSAEYVADTWVDTVVELTNGEFIKGVIEKFYSSDVIDTIVNDITGQTKTWMVGLTAALKAIAILIVVYHMVVTLMKELQRGEMTLESWLRILITFLLPAIAIAEYDVIINVFAKSGQWIYGILNENMEIYTDTSNTATGIPYPGFSIFDLGAFFEWLLAWIRGFILTIAYLIINFIIILMIMSGILTNFAEIVIRHMFMPIAFANISHEGVRSIGVRYIKKYLGCYMKIATIMVAVCALFYIYSLMLSVPGVTEIEKVVFFILLVPGTKKSLQMTNEIISDALGD